MRELLEWYEYIWSVIVENRDDGLWDVAARYTSHSAASEKAVKIMGKIRQDTLWKDSNGNYYEVELKQVDVDLPDKQEVLAKLTKQERRALGLT